MRPPAFWDRPARRPGVAARVLGPLGWLTARATAQRVARAPDHAASVPVLCVGNLHAGGTGKTPTVIALVERLATRGVRAHVVSRGHGGRLPGPIAVEPRRHSAADVGDEPLLLAAFAPVTVSRDRAAGVRAAESAGAQAVILDDGFQNPSVAKDLSIVVVDAARGFGNERCLPAGPLREPVGAGLSRAGLVLSIGDAQAQRDFGARYALPVPRATAQLEPLQTGMDWTDMPVLAFAGIGHPEKMFATLRALGADLRHAEALDDHQPIGPALIQRLQNDAARHGAQLVTTEKDAVRLPPDFRRTVLTLPVRLRFLDADALDAALDRVLR